jgi:carbon storage regulator
VVEIRGDVIRLSIEAPREVPVHRAEVQRRIENATARDAASAA